MKTRNGFVSNSSSSSFIILKDNLSELQIEQIKNYQDEAYKIGEYDKIKTDDDLGPHGKFGWIDDFWDITETETEIKGNTIMNNFDFQAFLITIGVEFENIQWDPDWE